MTRRLWFVAGAGAGVYATAKARRAVEAFSPDGLRDRMGAAMVGLRLFGAEVAAGKVEREAELRERLDRRTGLSERGTPELGPPGRPDDQWEQQT